MTQPLKLVSAETLSMTIFSFREGLEKWYHHWNEEVFILQLETHDDDVKVLFGELYLYGCFLNLNMTQKILGCSTVPLPWSVGTTAKVLQKLWQNKLTATYHSSAKQDWGMDTEI